MASSQCTSQRAFASSQQLPAYHDLDIREPIRHRRDPASLPLALLSRYPARPAFVMIFDTVMEFLIMRGESMYYARGPPAASNHASLRSSRPRCDAARPGRTRSGRSASSRSARASSRRSVQSSATCVEIKILRRVRAESPRRPPRHRRDACSMAWRCQFLAARPSQVGRVIAEK